jgi:hypothetical protein
LDIDLDDYRHVTALDWGNSMGDLSAILSSLSI